MVQDKRIICKFRKETPLFICQWSLQLMLLATFITLFIISLCFADIEVVAGVKNQLKSTKLVD